MLLIQSGLQPDTSGFLSIYIGIYRLKEIIQHLPPSLAKIRRMV
ncbi:hypothetical protein ACNVED_05715 [Legionella sp. D16C41]